MGPEYAAVATAIAAATTAATSVMSANAQSSVAKAQSQWADRQAKEEMAVAQRQAGEEQRKAQLAKSRLMSVAGASGSGVSDPTVLQLAQGIEQEGRYNAATALADGQRSADSMSYQAALDRWTAKANKRSAYLGAAGTLIGQTMGMKARYGSKGSTQGTGY